MYSQVLLSLIVLIISIFVLAKKFHINKNILILFSCLSLVVASMPVMVFVGGIVTLEMINDKSLATLPITLMVVGVALATIPAALLAKNKGRKYSTNTGLLAALLGAIIAMFSVMYASFIGFSIASLLLGASNAFLQQMRFAAIECTDNKEDIPKTLSILMLSGLFAAFIGPEITVAAKTLIPGQLDFAGAFFILSLLSLAGLIIFSQFQNPEITETENHAETRPLATIIKQPIFIIAIASAAIGYGLMSYLMTATPLSMHQMHGHSLLDTKWVIQSHIAAMFLPSLFTPWLVKKLGLKTLLYIGTAIYIVVTLVALAGHQVMHYWWSLVLLGIGWNFLFLVGTSLLPASYQESEKFKTQASNDFILFGFQAIASLLAGWVLFKGGWNTVVLSSIPFIILLLIVCWRYQKYQKQAS